MRDNTHSVTDDPASGVEVAVLVVDDQKSFRDALRDLIHDVRGFALVGEATSGEEATRAVAALAPQLVLMDVMMPGMGGIAAARMMLERLPAPMVVLISLDDPSLHRDAGSLHGTVTFLRKQELCALRLRQLWDVHRN